MGGFGREESILPSGGGMRGSQKGSERGPGGVSGCLRRGPHHLLSNFFTMVPAPIDDPHHWFAGLGGGLRGLFEGSERGFEGSETAAEGYFHPF